MNQIQAARAGVRRRGSSGACAVILVCLSATGRAETPATKPSATSIPAITIYHDSRRYNTFPDAKRLADGRLLCVFRDASFPDRVRHIEADARVVGSLSDDEGRTWSKPFVVYDDPACQNDPSVTLLRDGRLLLTFFNWNGLTAEYLAKVKPPPFARRVDRGAWGVYAEPGGVHVLWGCPDPKSWAGEACRVVGTNVVLRATSSSVLETKAGTLLLPIYGRSLDRRVDQAYVLRSTDRGKTWGDETLIAIDRAGKVAMQEPALAQMPKGDIVALLRTANAEDHLYTTRSSDDGRTWSPATRTPLIGHPADMQVLPNGKLLAAYGYRHEPFGVRACVSHDGGKTWDLQDQVVVTDTGAHTDLGYPSVCLTGDGHVLIAYYINAAGTTDRWIECKRIPLSLFD